MKYPLNFIFWKHNIKSELRGGILMYDVKGYYKWLTERELFDYYLNLK